MRMKINKIRLADEVSNFPLDKFENRAEEKYFAWRISNMYLIFKPSS